MTIKINYLPGAGINKYIESSLYLQNILKTFIICRTEVFVVTGHVINH